MHVGVHVKLHSLWQSPARVKEPASTSQLACWQLMAYFLAAQKLPIRHPPTGCALFCLLLPLPFPCSQRRRPPCPCSIFLTLPRCLPSLTGLVRSSGMFGPTLGFLLGSFCASLWVDVGVVDIGKRLWSGALTEEMALYRNLHAKKHLPSLLLQKRGSLESFSYSKAGVICILISAAL